MQYQELIADDLATAKVAVLSAGKEVWGYRCCGPGPAQYLNTFLDVPPMKARLIPWLAAGQDLSGWLYWYTNWGFRHASTSVDNATGLVVPLHPLDHSTGRSSYDPYADAHTNEDGNLMYSGPDGPLSSQRLELLRMGFDDRSLMSLLWRTGLNWRRGSCAQRTITPLILR